MDSRKNFYAKVGEKIRSKRQERGLSQEGLAKAIGLKRPSLANIEKGRQNILVHTLFDMAETLNVNIGDLLPERVAPGSVGISNLGSLSQGVREFVEAGIKRAHKTGD